jgi:ubiquinone/menaquinone biosynthesis C-methylase UbiE
MQTRVTRLFDDLADFWTEIYSAPGVAAGIYRRRLEMALAWVDSLAIPPGTPVLVVGAGAGFEAIALASKGFAITAVEPAAAMLAVARTRAEAAGCTGITWVRGDAHALGFGPGTFDLVLALGVIPWLHSPSLAMAEMGRVLRPGGWWLGSVDNSYRLDGFLDPARNPVVAPKARAVRDALLRKRSGSEPKAAQHSSNALRRLLDCAGADRIAEVTFGFGPFTFAGRPFLGDRAGKAVNTALSRLGERGAPIAKSTGAQRLALARKREVGVRDI